MINDYRFRKGKKKIVIHSLKINSDPNFTLHDIKKL